jgi:hypothetical protein
MTNKLKTTLFVLVALLFSTTAIAADSTKVAPKQEPYEMEVYGFVRNDFTFDSRKTLASVGELFSFIPMDNQLNSMGEDLNAVPSSRLLAVVSRLGFNFKSPTFNGMFINAKIETDFCGAGANYNMFRIRHAWVGLNWKHHQLLAGQSWHPMSGDLLPSIVSLNTGAPFNAFSRAPQVRYNAKINAVTLSAAAIYQLQYTAPGPKGNSTEYQVFGGMPEMYIGVTYAANGLKVGLGGEFMSLRPRTTAEVNGETVKVNETVNSISTQLFAQYSGKNFTAAAKSIYGQNTGHLLMMSGYGYYGTKEDGYSRNYAPLTQSSTWLTLAYHTAREKHNVRATVLGGYMKNFGAKHDLDGVYVRGYDNIDQIFRVAPSIQYLYKGLVLGVEYEYTGVMYGTPQANYSVAGDHLVGNHRAYVMLVYNFSHKFLK